MSETLASPRPRGGRPRNRRGRPLDGWLIIDKPQGLTSTDVVNRVRRAFDAQKAGHGGTLDPLATGVLPVAFGAATKTVPYVQDGTKLYRFTLRMGQARDTDDADGQITSESPNRPTDATLIAALRPFVGHILQVPPAYSAIKVAGERAYDLARSGRPPDLPPRSARVDRFTLVARPDADHAEFEVQSGKGVYMRSLARDLALACGTVGHIAVLRRLRVGPFTLDHAVTQETWHHITPEARPGAAQLLPPHAALADLPAISVSEAEAARLAQGQTLPLASLFPHLPAVPLGDGPVRAMSGQRLAALCRVQDGGLHPERVL